MTAHPEDLEQNLRSMILGNIRVAEPDQRKQNPSQPPALAGAPFAGPPWGNSNGQSFEHSQAHSRPWRPHGPPHHDHRHHHHPHHHHHHSHFDHSHPPPFDGPSRGHGPPRGGPPWDLHPHGHDHHRRHSHRRGHGHGPPGFHEHHEHHEHHGPPGLSMPVPGPHMSPWDQVTMMAPHRGRGGFRARGPRGRGNLYRPDANMRTPTLTMEELSLQTAHLQAISDAELPSLQMSDDEFRTKDAFRGRLEGLCQAAAAVHFQPDPVSISLQAFGSFASAFGLPGSDMDLAMIAPHLPDLPRVVEKALLDVGIGARLLSRTRVPILKICEAPTTELYAALLEERSKWDAMTPDEREVYDRGSRKADDKGPDDKDPDDADEKQPATISAAPSTDASAPAQAAPNTKPNGKDDEDPPPQNPNTPNPSTAAPDDPGASKAGDKAKPRRDRPWTREKKASPLDFPKTPPNAVGIQCDINFSTTLGLHNTALLRCYGATDARVRPLVLLVKRWASRRKINSGYSGTLSSYGYVLMVLHFLVNVASPPVSPNLQLSETHAGRARAYIPPSPSALVDGCDVRFWRSEGAIRARAAQGLLTHNRDALGHLLRNFFVYYAWQGGAAPQGGFSWTQDVLSLRSPGGLLSKQEKGWTGARTTLTADDKEVRHRYLLAIEDPFELEHNVARTVTHHGIVAIRDEFRRAARILDKIGRGAPLDEGGIFDLIVEEAPEPEAAGAARDADAAKEAGGDDAPAAKEEVAPPADIEPAAATV